MADDREAHRKYLERALKDGSFAWPPHSYSQVGPFLMYYLQGMLMSVWLIGTDIVHHVPIVWEQDIPSYRKHQRKFERSVQALERERKG